jgi:hypothetical protein
MRARPLRRKPASAIAAKRSHPAASAIQDAVAKALVGVLGPNHESDHRRPRLWPALSLLAGLVSAFTRQALSALGGGRPPAAWASRYQWPMPRCCRSCVNAGACQGLHPLVLVLISGCLLDTAALPRDGGVRRSRNGAAPSRPGRRPETDRIGDSRPSPSRPSGRPRACTPPRSCKQAAPRLLPLAVPKRNAPTDHSLPPYVGRAQQDASSSGLIDRAGAVV